MHNCPTYGYAIFKHHTPLGVSGVPPAFLYAIATIKSHLQSISIVIPCYSPTKSPRRCEASGKAKPFKGLFEPEDGFAVRKALSQIGVGRYGFCRTGVVMDWSNESDEIYFNHSHYNKT